MLFLKYRYDDIDISLICDYAKIKRTLFYHYFSSKEELFCEIYKRKITLSYDKLISENEENKAKFLLIELLNNIETKEIYRSIQAQGCNLRGICLWNEKYVIGASSDKGFKVINIENGTVEASIKGHDNVLCTVHKIVHPLYGESLVSSGIDGKIKLWRDAD